MGERARARKRASESEPERVGGTERNVKRAEDVSVCVRERQSESETARKRERGREKQRERAKKSERWQKRKKEGDREKEQKRGKSQIVGQQVATVLHVYIKCS